MFRHVSGDDEHANRTFKYGYGNSDYYGGRAEIQPDISRQFESRLGK